MAARFISNTTGRSLKDDKELESKQRTAEENLDRQITEDAREDVEVCCLMQICRDLLKDRAEVLMQ